ncbi:MAG: hypothetical protein ABIH76_07295 [Candidatus Bathyarchaeota archaeon]
MKKTEMTIFKKSTAEFGETVYPLQQDIFFCLKNPTITKIRNLFEWGHKRAMRTEVYSRENTNLDRRTVEENFEEVVEYINRKAKPYLRVILRKNWNWYLLLSNKKRFDDFIEIGIRGIDVGSKEYFIRCFLRKKLLSSIKKKFSLEEIT